MPRTGCLRLLAACQVPHRGPVLASSPGGFRRVVKDVRDHRVQGGFEGVGSVLGLGEKQPALHGGEQGEGKPARVGIAWQRVLPRHLITCPQEWI